MKYLKKIIFLLILSLLYNSNAYPNNKIVFFDIEYVINNSIIGKKVLSNLEKIKTDENKKLSIVENSLKKQNEEIKNLKNVISKEELQTKINQFQKDIKQYNINKDKVQKDFINNKNKKLDDLFKKINPLIIKFMSDNSIDLVLSKKNIYLAKTELDITEDMIELINKNFK
jgi:outer membrane protein